MIHKYPYTNFHELNLDWIINKIKELNDKIDDMIISSDGVPGNIYFLSQWEEDTDDTLILQNALNYCAQRQYILFIDKNITINNSIIVPSNSYIISNPLKYRVYTTTGTSGDGLAMFTAYNASNITIKNVKIENTGYGASGSAGSPGLFDGFGAGLNFGNCDNVTIENCILYKCGGYNYGEGCACIWLSCCTNSIIKNNICYCADNGITVDRWNANINPDGFNDNILIDGNILTQLSGRGVVIENTQYNGRIIVTNNMINAYGVAGIEGRTFNNVTITDNMINGDAQLKVNPIVEYGLNGSGWDWSANIVNNGSYGVQLISGGSDFIIESNNITNVGQDIFLGDPISGTIANNKLSNATSHAVYISSTTNDIDGMVIANNRITDAVTTAIYLRATATHIATNVIINGNIFEATSNAINITYANNVMITNNIINQTANDTIILDHCSEVYSANKGDSASNYFQLTYITTMRINELISNASNLLRCRNNCIDITGSINVNTVTNFINGDTTCTGHLEISAQTLSKVKANNTNITYTMRSATIPAGNGTIGDTVYYTDPVSIGYIGAVCTVAGGSPTWSNFGAIA